MKSKEKMQKIRQHRNRTGGGPPSDITLSDFDLKMLEIIGEACADGDSNLNEIGFDTGTYTINSSQTIDFHICFFFLSAVHCMHCFFLLI